MLFITRNINESFMIGNNIKVMYRGIDYRGEVILGIDAPREVSILRQEVFERYQRNKIKNKTMEVKNEESKHEQ